MESGTVKRIQEGDSDAFKQVYDSLADPALRFAAAVLGSDGMAADAVQEAFLRAYRNIRRFDALKPFEPWFFRILLNECRRVYRWRGRLTPLETLPETAAEPRDYGALYDAVGSLDPALKEPLVLKYILGYQDREVAGILGITLTAAKGRVKRARQRLRRFLEGDDEL